MAHVEVRENGKLISLGGVDSEEDQNPPGDVGRGDATLPAVRDVSRPGGDQADGHHGPTRRVRRGPVADVPAVTTLDHAEVPYGST